MFSIKCMISSKLARISAMPEGHRPIRLTRREVPPEPKGQWRTYDDWISAGRHVMKGQRSLRRDADGKPVFSLEQTDAAPLQRGVKPDHFEDDDSLAARPRDDHFFPDYAGDSWGDQG